MKFSIKNIVILLLFFLFRAIGSFSQTHPGTGVASPCSSCVPEGWILDAGSPDVSDASQWGANGAAWTKAIPPIPNGETTFMSAHSTEVASMIIKDLTPGESYTLVFYYMTVLNSSPAFGGYGGSLSPTVRYSVDNGAVIERPIAQEATWYKENVVFTASDTTARFTFYGGGHDGNFPGFGFSDGDVSNISFAPNSVIPSNPSCSSYTITVGEDKTICKGETAQLNANGADSFLWSPNGDSGPSIFVNPEVTTVYSVTGTNSSGCSATENISVTVTPTPLISITPDTICLGDTAILKVTGGGIYKWSTGELGDEIRVSPTQTTVYSVSAPEVGCSSSSSGTVKVYDKPSADFDYSPNPIGVYHSEVSFLDKSSADVSAWSWDFDDVSTSVSNEQNPSYEFPAVEKTYDVTLIVENPGHCKDTITKLVTVGPEFTLYLPNAFSPNDDFVNDNFGAKGEGIQEFKMTIHDRWGELLFTSEDINDWWDGKYKSTVVREGVYVWTVFAKDIFNDNHRYKGLVSVVR